ncbi:DUF4362 domain-containing protein [Bacillus cereus]|uniref:DUF4362 domain-containing protein n=1 Tax=Bacillus cereus TaxID=1396 RepID=UPI003079F5DD
MKKILVGLIIGTLTLSGCSLNIGNSKDQEEVTKETGSKIVTENPKEDTDKSKISSNPKRPYRPESAIKNGDVVNIHGKISNLDKFENFINHIKSGDKDKIRITSYTIEGDPIFYNLIYDGNQIQYNYDDSQDAFGGPDKGIQSTSCSNIEKKDAENRVEYHLSGCSSEVGNTFYFMISK